MLFILIVSETHFMFIFGHITCWQISIMTWQVPFTESVCKMVVVEVCSPIKVTKCKNVNENVRFVIFRFCQHKSPPYGQ